VEFGILRWRYERWRYETGGFVVSSPAVVAGVVYVGSWDDYVYALDAGAIDSRLRGNDVARGRHGVERAGMV